MLGLIGRAPAGQRRPRQPGGDVKMMARVDEAFASQDRRPEIIGDGASRGDQ